MNTKAEEILYKHILADAEKRLKEDKNIVSIHTPPLEELKKEKFFQIHISAIEEYASSLQPSLDEEGINQLLKTDTTFRHEPEARSDYVFAFKRGYKAALSSIPLDEEIYVKLSVQKEKPPLDEPVLCSNDGDFKELVFRSDENRRNIIYDYGMTHWLKKTTIRELINQK